jgi:hypothetical protein
MNSDFQAKLLSRLDQSEDPWVERRQSFNEREVRKTLVAFANSVREGEAAVFFLGASNDGHHPGLADADDTQKKVRLQATEKCYPPIESQACVLPVRVNGQSREVLAVVVPFSQNRPQFAGVAYIRQGSESKAASAEVFKELIASQNEKARRLLQYKGQRVMLRFRSESRFSYDVEGVVQSCDAITVTIRDQEMSLWSFPIRVMSTLNPVGRPALAFEGRRVESAARQRLTLRWQMA